eukprot:107593-Hanusia_phi.AAC.1
MIVFLGCGQGAPGLDLGYPAEHTLGQPCSWESISLVTCSASIISLSDESRIEPGGCVAMRRMSRGRGEGRGRRGEEGEQREDQGGKGRGEERRGEERRGEERRGEEGGRKGAKRRSGM